MHRKSAQAPPICQSVKPLYLEWQRATATCSLRCLLLLGLESLLAVAPNHDNGKEGADDGGEQDDQDYRDADGPDAGKEE